MKDLREFLVGDRRFIKAKLADPSNVSFKLAVQFVRTGKFHNKWDNWDLKPEHARRAKPTKKGLLEGEGLDTFSHRNADITANSREALVEIEEGTDYNAVCLDITDSREAPVEIEEGNDCNDCNIENILKATNDKVEFSDPKIDRLAPGRDSDGENVRLRANTCQ